MSGIVILGLIFAGLTLTGLIGMAFRQIDNVGPMSAHRYPHRDNSS